MSEKYNLLIVDDLETERHKYESIVRASIHVNEHWDADNAGAALALLSENKEINFVLADVFMPPHCDGETPRDDATPFGGIFLVREIAKRKLHERHAKLKILLISNKHDARRHIRTLLEGYDDLYTFVDKGDDKKLRNNLTGGVFDSIREWAGVQLSAGEIIGKSPKLEEAVKFAEAVAATNETVLLFGETGTGKELFASLIHERSKRFKERILRCNLTALPEKIIESELFGHIKGAYTGATATRFGRFHKADKGTLVLDEIGNITPAVQTKLLRVIEDKMVAQVGSSEYTKVDTRIIAATNKDLENEIKEGRFMEDLYHRLTLHVNIPPLRERLEDIPRLADYLMKKYCTKNNVEAKEVSTRAYDLLNNYNFPGNVRELNQGLTEAMLWAKMKNSSTLEPEHFKDIYEKQQSITVTGSIPKSGFNRAAYLKQLDKDLIIKVLKQANNNKAEAARILNISRQYLHKLIEEHNIEL